MKKILLSLGVVALTVGALMAKPDSKSEAESVLMTVNGRPVYVGEFEYLYNKNAEQQVERQSLDDYVEMFVNYKLKVADALANGYDTTESYKTELTQYRNELAAPYMVDAEALDSLKNDAYNRYSHQLKVSHIMLPFDQNNRDESAFARADSIKSEVLAGRLDWNEAAKRFSMDRGTSENGGSMGWLVVGRFPIEFEDMAYATPTGQISKPVNSGYGVHIIRVDADRPNPGEVKARHILKLTARKSPEEAAKAKEQIDSIYTVLMNGADFADVARAESEDPGSKANGGDLDWFSSGMMVAPFDSAAFSMEPGVISRPIQTAYGWHIIEVTGRRPMKTRSEMDENLKQMVDMSPKHLIPARRYLEKQGVKYKSHLLKGNLDKVESMIAANPEGYDSTMVATLGTMSIPVAEVAGEAIALSEVMPGVAVTAARDAKNARSLIEVAAKRAMEDRTREKSRLDLANVNPEYRNLINEYSDGILLFDISQDKVWQRATTDRDGLEEYFRTHKSQYSFDEPRYKAVIVFTTSDSLETEVKNYLNTPGLKINPLTIGKELRDKFGRHVRAERVIAKKGENPITDYLAFGGPVPENKTLSWSNYFAICDEIIEQPQEADDVRSRVTSDYQTHLEKQWISDLRARYPVKINKKVLKTVKEIPVNQKETK